MSFISRKVSTKGLMRITVEDEFGNSKIYNGFDVLYRKPELQYLYIVCDRCKRAGILGSTMCLDKEKLCPDCYEKAIINEVE